MSRRIHIFLAEDNPGDVELVRESLREHNIQYQLFLASDGAEVRRYLENLGRESDIPSPDLVLLDLNLPQAHGYELFEVLRSHPLCKETPVIIVTSSGAPKDRERAAHLGAVRYFRKPIDLAEFLELGSLIRQVVSEQGLLAASESPAG